MRISKSGLSRRAAAGTRPIGREQLGLSGSESGNPPSPIKGSWVGRRPGVLAAFAAALLAVGAPSSAAAQTAPTASAPPPKWGSWLDLEGKAGNKRNIGEADVFVPLWQNNDTLLFGSLRTRLDDEGSREGNFGAGLRHMLPSGWNIGGYGYFDRRKTDHDNYFNQVTLGAEALSLDWDVRANVYLPEGRRSHQVDSLTRVDFSGTSVIIRGGDEHSLTGFDGEIGWRVPVFKAEGDKQLRLFGGAYRFYGEGVDPVQGPRVRAEFTVDEVPGLWKGARLTLGAEAQHDGPRGGQVFAGARLRVPLQVFGGGSAPSQLTPMERRMTDPIVRDVDVVAQVGQTAETATMANGQALTFISSAGFSATSLTNQFTAAGQNSTVILSGTFNTTQASPLQAGQTVRAGTTTVRSASGRTATVTTSASIVGTGIAGNGTVLLNAANSTISGLTISNTVNGTGATAVQITAGGTGARVIGNTITATETGGSTGLGISGFNSSATITGNTVTATGDSGTTAALSLNGGTYTVSGNSLTGTDNGAPSPTTIRLQNNITFNADSTGNTLASGNCSNTGTITGSIGLAGGATCP